MKLDVMPLPTEEQEQRLLVDWMSLMQEIGKDILFTHIPMSTWTKSWAQKHKNRFMGVRPGFPDLIVIVNRKLLIIEMKRRKGGRLSPEQSIWIQKLRDAGLFVSVCYGYDDARSLIEQYL